MIWLCAIFFLKVLKFSSCLILSKFLLGSWLLMLLRRHLVKFMKFDIKLSGFSYTLVVYLNSTNLGKKPIESRGFRVYKQPRNFVKIIVKQLRHRAILIEVNKLMLFGIWGISHSKLPYLVFEASLWRLAPLRAPRSPTLLPFPSSFHLSTLELYMCFLVYLYTIRYV